jgi:hypothetical protein
MVLDVDRDGFPDVLIPGTVMSPDSLSVMKILSCFHNHGGGFRDTPDRILHLGNAEWLFDLADTDRDGHMDLVSLSGGAVLVRTCRDSGLAQAPETLAVSRAPVVPSMTALAWMHWPFASLPVRSGATVFLVPRQDGMELISGSSGSADILGVWQEASPVMRPAHNHRSPAFRLELPDLHFADWNGDGLTDAVAVTAESVSVLDGGIVSETGRPRVHSLPVRRFMPDGSPDSAAAISFPVRRLLVQDLNADGSADVLSVMAPAPGLFMPPGRIGVYLGRAGRFGTMPDAVLLIEGFFGDVVLRDFNRDGRMDLGLVSLENGTLDLTRYMLTQKIRNRMTVHLARENGSYAADPDAVFVFSRKQNPRDLFALPLVDAPLCGDTNGDGFTDFVYRSARETLCVANMTAAWKLAARNALEVRVPSESRILAEDLNRDGRTDLVLLSAEPPRGTRLRILTAAQGENP